MTLGTGSLAPDAVVYASDGTEVPCSHLWREAAIVIAFLRHFGSPFSRDWVGALRDEYTRIDAAGASIVCVAMGTPAQTERYRSERGLPFACLADPDRSAYRAFAVGTGGPSRWLLNARVGLRLAVLARRGVAAGLPHPGQDVRQLPATFVVARGGTVRLAHYAADAADAPRMQDVLGAVGAG